MYSLMIIDDEEIILNGISDAIKVSGLPFKEIRTAQSAAEALKGLSRRPCDILLSDISMPEENGLEMVRRAKRIWPDIRVIFLTGYQDFEFVREALRLGSDDFLLKPVSDEKLLDAVTRVIAQLDREWMQRFEMRRERLPEEMERFEPMSPVRLIFLQYGIQELRMDGKELQESLRSMLERALSYYSSRITFEQGTDTTIVGMEPKESWETIKNAVLKVLEEIQSFFLEQLDIEMTISISGDIVYKDMGRVISRWREASEDRKDYGKLFMLEEKPETAQEDGNYLIQAIRSHIQEHPAADLSLGALSERFHINPSYLSRIFHQETGQPLSEYILQLRMQLARRLLVDTDAKIYEIAQQTGFGTSGYFTKVFQKKENMSPKNYRIRQRIQK